MRALPVVLGVVLTLVIPGLQARGDTPDAPAWPVEVKVSPQAIETPILKYRLLPTESELRPGNAATILLRMPWGRTKYFADVVPTFDKWAVLPLNDPEWRASDGVLSESLYQEMKRAAFRRDAAWEYPIGEAESMSHILLPDVQEGRLLFRDGLVGRIRYHLARREFDKAREAILVGLAIFRHVARTPFLVIQLQASWNARAMLDCVDEMIGLPRSPNLYWSLGTLPRPLFNLGPSVELQQAMQMDFPALADLNRPRDAAEWEKLCNGLLSHLNDEARAASGANGVISRETFLEYADHHRDQWSAGLPPRADKTSDDEAIVRAILWRNTRQSQMLTALFALPPPEAIPALQRFEQDALADSAELGGAAKSIPWQYKALNLYLAPWSLQRKIDALRAVEAIRDFAAGHGGKLPEKLTDVTAVSVPVDPLTGHPFRWAIDKNGGRLSGETIEGEENPTLTMLEYVLTVR